MKEIIITQEEEAELVGQIVDVFEDFLKAKALMSKTRRETVRKVPPSSSVRTTILSQMEYAM